MLTFVVLGLGPGGQYEPASIFESFDNHQGFRNAHSAMRLMRRNCEESMIVIYHGPSDRSGILYAPSWSLAHSLGQLGVKS